MLLTFFKGMFIGAADVVPGVSGGTIAFILGIYERLINAIKGVGTKNWDPSFLLPLLAGVATAIVTFSHLIEELLNNEVTRTYLYSTFLGLILGSTLFCSKQVKQWSTSRLFALTIGMVIAFLFTRHVSLTQAPPIPESLWVVICGSMAISAMLLPGISGSYLLNILGIYPTVLQNLNAFTSSLAAGSFAVSSFQFLALLLLGIVLGAVLFSRVVSWCLKRYHDLSIAALTGFMLGALRAVWPFWIYRKAEHPFKINHGDVLVPTDMVLPDPSSDLFFHAMLFVLAGFVLVILMEAVARWIGEK